MQRSHWNKKGICSERDPLWVLRIWNKYSLSKLRKITNDEVFGGKEILPCTNRQGLSD